MGYKVRGILRVALVAGVLSSAADGVETSNCTPISVLPFSIDTQGSYCLTKHLSTNATTGCAILINKSNVVIDLNGFKLDGTAAGPTTDARGICAVARSNITVHNGTIRGFLIGVALVDIPNSLSSGNLVENIRADHNRLYGIEVDGSNHLIRGNHVFATGGTNIYGTAPQGIFVEYGSGTQVLDNTINDTQFDAQTLSQAIWFLGTANVMALHNRIEGAHIGIRFQNSTGIYRGNTVLNVSTPGAAYVDGTNAGENYP